jgi:hypothetical protein
MPPVKSVLFLRRDNIIGRGDDFAEVAGLLGVVADPLKGKNKSHSRFSLWNFVFFEGQKLYNMKKERRKAPKNTREYSTMGFSAEFESAYTSFF